MNIMKTKIYNKYTLRKHINSINNYIKMLDDYDIDYYHKLTISNHLNRRLIRIKEYLNIKYDKPKKVSINDMFRNNYKYMKEE